MSENISIPRSQIAAWERLIESDPYARAHSAGIWLDGTRQFLEATKILEKRVKELQDELSQKTASAIPPEPEKSATEPIFDDGGHPIRKVVAIILIKNVATGEVRCMNEFYITPDSNYMWEFGNYSCDCNRRAFFGRSCDVDSDEEYSCSEGQFLVNVMDPNTLEFTYKEF